MAKVKFGASQINNPTPVLWERISSAIRYFLVGAITTISATDIIPDKTVKYITLSCGLAILLLKAIDMGLGVQPAEIKEDPTQDPFTK